MTKKTLQIKERKSEMSKKKKKKITHIICVLDRSGSMGSLETEVINSFNTFVEEQKKVKGKASLTLVVFDDQYDVIYDEVDIKDVSPLTKEKYFARGMTALNDAIGITLEKFTKKKNVIFLVQTDGMENASQKFNSDKVKTLVEDKQKKGWEFIFHGANIDAFAEGGARGFTLTRGFNPTKMGVMDMYSSINKSATLYRSKNS